MRLASVCLSPRFPRIDTPVCLQYTRSGVIPHVTWDLLAHLEDDGAPLLSPVASLLPLQQPLRSLSCDLHGFCRLPSRPVFLSVYDPTTPLLPGANKKAGIAYSRREGLRRINGLAYLDLISLVKPQAFQSLADADTPKDASPKRLGHSLSRTLGYLDEMRLRQQHGLVAAEGASVFASVVGGHDAHTREVSVKDLLERSVDGYVLEAFHDYDPAKTLHLEPETIGLVNRVTGCLPKEAPKALFGCFSPEIMLQLMEAGIDIFDSSVATVLTERGHAMVIKVTSPAGDSTQGLSVETQVLDLRERKFKEDMTVIARGCRCYACKQLFTKAYINHLLVTKEMLASVLLNLHNIFALYDFFREVRSHASATDAREPRMKS